MPPFLEILRFDVPSPLEIPRLMYPSPGNLKLMHLSPGNSKVNAPPPLEIPRFLNRGGADNNWNSPFRQRKQFFLVLLSLQTIFLHLLPSANNFFVHLIAVDFIIN